MKTSEVVLIAAGAAVVGAVLGAALGASVTLLTAPKSGKETREDLKNFLREKNPFLKEHQLDALAEKVSEEIKNACN